MFSNLTTFAAFVSTRFEPPRHAGTAQQSDVPDVTALLVPQPPEFGLPLAFAAATQVDATELDTQPMTPVRWNPAVAAV